MVGGVPFVVVHSMIHEMQLLFIAWVVPKPVPIKVSGSHMYSM